MNKQTFDQDAYKHSQLDQCREPNTFSTLSIVVAVIAFGGGIASFGLMFLFWGSTDLQSRNAMPMFAESFIFLSVYWVSAICCGFFLGGVYEIARRKK